MFYNNRLFLSSKQYFISYSKCLRCPTREFENHLKLNIFSNSVMAITFPYLTKTRTEEQLHLADYKTTTNYLFDYGDTTLLYLHGLINAFLFNIEARFGLCQKCKAELYFGKIVKVFQLLLIFAKQINHRCLTGDHSLSRYTKFSKKLTFFAPWYAHVCVSIRDKKFSFSENVTYVLNVWFSKVLNMSLKLFYWKESAV